MLPPERQVDCACDVHMQRAVLHEHSGWNVRVTACMRCGTVTATRSIVEEPRPHDVRPIGNEVIALAPDALAWLAQWPRVAGEIWHRAQGTYLPHDVRCGSNQELVDLEARALTSAPAKRIERLRAAGIPTAPPPPSLPPELVAFRQHHEALSLPDGAAPAAVLAVIAHNPSTTPVVRQLLVAGPESDAALADALRSANRRTAAILALTGDPLLVGDEVVRACESLIASFTSEADDGATAIVHTVGALGARMKPVIPALEALAKRIDVQREYYFHKAVIDAVARLSAAR